MLMGPLFLLAAFHTFFVASPLGRGRRPLDIDGEEFQSLE